MWGTSANARAWYDLSEANAIGDRPTVNTEVFASDVIARPNPLDPVARRLQGGAFVTIDYTPLERQPGGGR